VVSRARGKIVCMSSVHQQIACGGHVNRVASKVGVTMLMLMLMLMQSVALLVERGMSRYPGFRDNG